MFSSLVGSPAALSLPAEFYLGPVAADPTGNLLLAGYTLQDGYVIRIDDIGSGGPQIVSLGNEASHVAQPLAPGERVTVLTRDVPEGGRVLIDGTPLPAVAQAADSITVQMPDDIDSRPAVSVEVDYGSGHTPPVVMATANYAPGIYTADGSGTGQAVVFNQDGSLNSPDNPAAQNSIITIPVNGIGRLTFVSGSAVAERPVNVFVNQRYCYGVDALVRPLPGIADAIYQIKVFVPDFKLDQAAIVPLGVSFWNPVASQAGVTIAVKP